MNLKLISIGTATILAMAVGACSAGHSPVSQRQAAMKDIGAQMKTLGAMARIGGTYDDFFAISAFEAMLDDANIALQSFPPGSDNGENTRTKTAIWSEGSDFSTRMQAFQRNIAAAVEAEPADQASFVPLFAAISGNCKSCHELYRAPKN